ncbi:xanthine dehydrogenase family protein molybdopterin-binding subunit [Streptomyces sp. G-G2]|uniref:xanthine dehydrogenase family protein molybdopterin-binding subunit n=1 Tax=Streptomyces sp. G-G2 TaxID=3046201 RepID=UPI0024BA7AD1|nr:xanthine dehydrogenase family protein molybdopterin-binding subunit [Streptomyces sp. G-G2]MDJ0382891.1 xanthine dehydrogenase family protein molybdopterin-binding subunit [Streptomyces sp. G-G2]
MSAGVTEATGVTGAVGRSVPRLEDDRLLRGRGRFHDEVVRPGQLWMRVVRSPLAHARILGVDTARAAALPGVAAVLTAGDLPPGLRIPVRQPHPGLDFTPYLQPPLATGHVRYAGEPVAVVLAEDPYLAEDAAELVRLDLAELTPALDARTAAAGPPSESLPGAPPPQVGTVDFGYGDVDAAFAAAAHVVSADLRTGRHSGTPLEPRGLIAELDDRDGPGGRITIWGAAKIPHINRRVLAGLLAVPEHRIHMRETDAGGSFGIRGEFYPEDFLVPFLCLRTGRPVKWSEDRAEHMSAANHAREQEHRIELALDEGGRLLGLRDEAWLDNGAYIRTHGAVVAALTASMISGAYRVPACRSRVHIVTTNKTPIGTYRAPGRFQHNFVREHALDLAATRLGLDPVELRRINLLTSAELPHQRPMQVFGSPMVLDGKDHLEHFDKALRDVGYERWRAETRAARAAGRLVGTGCAVILEKAGLGYDSAVVDIGVTGAVRVSMGGANVGQGIETVMAQIAADELAVPVESVRVVLSDTDVLPDGGGTFGSRSTVVGGEAVRRAAVAVREKAARVAAGLLDVPPESVRLVAGGLGSHSGPGEVGWAALAAASFTPRWIRTGEEVGLIGRATYAADGMTYPYGAHFAQAEVDPGTGEVRLLRYAMTYEIGRAVHPEAVRGQLIGGAVQGIGGALSEEFRYDARGRPLSLTLDDYVWPRAASLPEIQVEIYEDAPAPGNPLGLRGAGEGGTAGSGAAVAGAVRDALGLPGDVGALPLHPARVRSLMSVRHPAHDPKRRKKEEL